MLGYITVNKCELKVKDLDRYQGFYCGVCRDIGDGHSQTARLTLTYDMTFLALLLSALYEDKSDITLRRCILHPTEKRFCIRNEYTKYAGDMCVLLTYHNLCDDWLDEKNRKSLMMARILYPAYKKTAAGYPRQTRAVKQYIRKLHEMEKRREENIEAAAGLTGKMFEQIFIYRDDEWKADLGALGFYLGKFIYLMDAYEDVYEDMRKRNYNPLIPLAKEKIFEKKTEDILLMMISAAAAVFERLPIVKDVDILRNIIYSGVWTKYNMIREKRKG